MQQTVMIELDEIEPRKRQSRQAFDQEKLQELSDSIKEQGVLQPILVRRNGQQKYEIIAGERRYRASKMAGLTKIPAIVKEADDTGTMVDSFLENAQREDLTPAEKEDALIALWNTGSFKTPKDLDNKLGYATGYSGSIIEARAFREKNDVPTSITTTTIVSTKGLPELTRKRLLLKVSKDQGKFGQVRTVREIKSVLEGAPEKIADQLLDDRITVDDARKAVELYKSSDSNEFKPLASAIAEGKVDVVSAEKTLRIYEDLKQKGIPLNPEIIERDIEEVVRQTALDAVHEKQMTQTRLDVLSGRKKTIDFKHWAEGLEKDAPSVQWANWYKWNLIRGEKYDFFTTHYSQKDVETFGEILKTAGVKTLIDVRDTPFSQFRPEFNKESLAKAMKNKGIKYVHVPELGVPKEQRDKLAKSSDWKELGEWYKENVIPKLNDMLDGHQKIKDLDKPYAFMCVEKDPNSCHRHWIAEALERKGLKSQDL